jgi:enterochelin esterase-like enzyme
VLYLNDGQDSESLDLAAALERSQQDGSAAPIVVVAIHATGDRIREYGTAGVPNAQGYGDRASQYEQFMLTELMPFIQSRYRVLTGPPATAIAGLSLGGLSAFDLAWRNPDRIGAVGVMSGSFWWRTNDRSPELKAGLSDHASPRAGDSWPPRSPYVVRNRGPRRSRRPGRRRRDRLHPGHRRTSGGNSA